MRKILIFILAVFIAFSFTPKSSFAAIVINPTNDNHVIIPSEPDPATVKAAMEEFKNLSKKEKKERLKQLKAAIRHYKEAKKKGGDVDTSTLLLVLISLILPPLAVYLHENDTNNKFWIDLILAILGIVGIFAIGWYCWLAAVIYALIVVLQGKVN